MPGVGKSTIGVVLAKILGMEFVDSDLIIQKSQGKLLKEIISEVGTNGFLTIEDEVHADLNVNNSIIATGGSVVYCQNGMEHLRDISIIVYLKLDYDLLAHRLGNLTARGVVLREHQTLQDLYKERTPLYEKYAHITIDETSLNIEQTIDAILKALHRAK